MMKRCRAGGKEEGGERGREGGGGGGGVGFSGGDTKETISFRSQELIKAVCLQHQALSAEEGVVDFHRGGLSGIDGESSGWQTEQEMEGGRCQWCGDWLSGRGWQS